MAGHGWRRRWCRRRRRRRVRGLRLIVGVGVGVGLGVGVGVGSRRPCLNLNVVGTRDEEADRVGVEQPALVPPALEWRELDVLHAVC